MHRIVSFAIFLFAWTYYYCSILRLLCRNQFKPLAYFGRCNLVKIREFHWKINLPSCILQYAEGPPVKPFGW